MSFSLYDWWSKLLDIITIYFTDTKNKKAFVKIKHSKRVQLYKYKNVTFLSWQVCLCWVCEVTHT